MRLDLEDQVISSGEGPNIVEAWELKRPDDRISRSGPDRRRRHISSDKVVWKIIVRGRARENTMVSFRGQVASLEAYQGENRSTQNRFAPPPISKSAYKRRAPVIIL
jgi:hypothetical protein